MAATSRQAAGLRRPSRRLAAVGAAAGALAVPPSYGRTIWPSRSLCTPAATIHSPLASPLVDDDAVLAILADVDRPQRDVARLRVVDPYRGRAVLAIDRRRAAAARRRAGSRR